MVTLTEISDADTEPHDYWSQTRRPLACLVFLLPLLAVYEIGVISAGGSNAEIARNGADAWLRSGLQSIGFHQPWLLPAVIVGGLLAWHAACRDPLRIPLDTLPGMLAESVLFAFVLVAAGHGGELLFRELRIPPTLSLAEPSRTAAAVTFIGAGIYEEVLFRLCLLPAFLGLFRLSRLSPRFVPWLAVLSTSLMFSLAHHVGPGAEAFALFPFAFRTLAGTFFAVLFLYRGFGITVGTHAAYDLLVGMASG